MVAFVTISGLKWTVFPAKRAEHFQNRKGKNVASLNVVILPRPSQPLCVRIKLYFIFAATSFYLQQPFIFCSNFNLFSLQQLFLICCIKQLKMAPTFNIAADIIIPRARVFRFSNLSLTQCAPSQWRELYTEDLCGFWKSTLFMDSYIRYKGSPF